MTHFDPPISFVFRRKFDRNKFADFVLDYAEYLPADVTLCQDDRGYTADVGWSPVGIRKLTQFAKSVGGQRS